MKALSIKQPWLYAITDLNKIIENRTWKPPAQIIGQRIALHASKKPDRVGYPAIAKIAGIEVPADVPLGSIVATAVVAGWIGENGYGDVPSPCYGHFVDDKWFFGPIGWFLEDVQKLKEPLLCRGMLGLWTVQQELCRQISFELEGGRN